ncbi:MAG: hypothetical protein JNK29_13795, partial [Anaerolineales bacterium]|nr:hypothetical protein [Anaerolineales bacterium]
IYRRHPETGAPLYAAEAALFGPLDPAEGGRVEALAAELHHLLSQADTGQLYAPLGLGRHVDHQLTRAVAERLGRPLTFYEDYPYAARTPAGPAWDGLAAGCQPRLAEIDEQDLDFYCLAVGAYRSQLSTFWTDEAAMRADVRGFCTRLAAGGLGLRLWDTQSA